MVFVRAPHTGWTLLCIQAQTIIRLEFRHDYKQCGRMTLLVSFGTCELSLLSII